MEVIGHQNCYEHSSKCLLPCPQKKEDHTGLENMMMSKWWQTFFNANLQHSSSIRLGKKPKKL